MYVEKFIHKTRYFYTFIFFKDADPTTIRPLSILERAFPFVMNKYRANKHWPYISDQLRSIRQDLMVQSIRNDFTVLIYEENARLALEMVRFEIIDFRKNKLLLLFCLSRVIVNSSINVKHN